MSGEHHFHVAAAIEVGVNAAILLDQFDYWITKNRANNRHYHDGCYWTYNSTKAFTQMYPYLSQKAIRTALKRLEDEGYIVVGDYNKDRMVRPKWYSITDKGYALLYSSQRPKGQGELPLGANRAAAEGSSLNIYSSSSSTGSSSSTNNGDESKKGNTEAIKAVIDYFNERVGTHYTYRNKEVNGFINARLREGFSVEDFKTVVDKKVASWKGTEWEKFLRPKTLFAPSHFEDYLNEQQPKPKVDFSAYAVENWAHPVEYRGGGNGAPVDS